MSAQREKRPSYIRQAWLVILLGLLYGAALAGVQTGLGPIIEENKRRETFSVIPELVPGTDREHITALEVETAKGKARRVYRAGGPDDQLRGWVIAAGGLGFADRIDVLIGLDPHVEQITGMYVLDQKETPGLGNLIVEDDFRDQFIDKSALKPLEVVKTEAAPGSNEIRTVTGATISSQSVADIINKAIDELRQPILEQATSKP